MFKLHLVALCKAKSLWPNLPFYVLLAYRCDRSRHVNLDLHPNVNGYASLIVTGHLDIARHA